MAKIVLDTVTGGYDLSVINNNFDKIESEFQNKVLYRDNPTGEANTLQSDIDANGKVIYNLPEPLLGSQAARLQDIQNAVAGAAANLITFTPYGHVAGDNVQAAVQELIDDTTNNGVTLPVFLKNYNMLLVDNISQLKAVDKTKFTRVFVLGYYSKGDGGGGDYWYDSADTTSVDNNGTIIVATDGARWKLAFNDILRPQQFGAKADGATDDASVIASVASFCVTNKIALRLEGNFGISKLTLTSLTGLNIECDATFTAISGSAQTAVLELVSCQSFYISGRLHINVGYKTNYDCAVWIHAPVATQFIDISAISVDAAKLAFKFGNVSFPDAIVSEITVHGGHTYGCPSVFEARGTQTFVQIMGVNWSADYFGGAGAWLALPSLLGKIVGSQVTFTGGELLMTETTTGLLFQVEPVESVAYDDRYGSLLVNGSTIETASPLAKAINPGVAAPAAGTGVLHFSNCTGFHSQDLDAFIFTAASFTGKIVVDSCKFYSTLTRTQANIFCDGNTPIYCDKQSFSTGFKGWFDGITGGLPDGQAGAMFYKNSSQAIAAGVWVKVTATTGLFSSFRGADLANSRFVAPVTGVYIISFCSYGSSSSAASTFTVSIWKNGSLNIAGCTGYSDAVNTPANSTVYLTTLLTAGDIIEFYAQASAANFSVNNSLGNSTFSVVQVQ